jgi:hypothetical protein
MDIFLGLAEGGGAGEWGHGFDGEDNQSLRLTCDPGPRSAKVESVWRSQSRDPGLKLITVFIGFKSWYCSGFVIHECATVSLKETKARCLLMLVRHA